MYQLSKNKSKPKKSGVIIEKIHEHGQTQEGEWTNRQDGVSRFCVGEEGVQAKVPKGVSLDLPFMRLSIINFQGKVTFGSMREVAPQGFRGSPVYIYEID